MVAVEHWDSDSLARSTRVVHPLWVAVSACLLIALGTNGYSGRSRTQSRLSISTWAAPVLEAAIFTAASPDCDPIRPKAASFAGGLLSAAGSPALVATIVHARILDEITVSRMGGLYGP